MPVKTDIQMNGRLRHLGKIAMQTKVSSSNFALIAKYNHRLFRADVRCVVPTTIVQSGVSERKIWLKNEDQFSIRKISENKRPFIIHATFIFLSFWFVMKFFILYLMFSLFQNYLICMAVWNTDIGSLAMINIWSF